MKQRAASRSQQRGQTSVEYFVVIAFAILVLIEGADASAISQVTTTMKDLYQGYTYAISYATTRNAFQPMALRIFARTNRMWLMLAAAIALGLFATWLAVNCLKTREARLS